MVVHTVENTKQIPGDKKFRMYSLLTGKAEETTIEKIIELYKQRYGVELDECWQWGNYIFVEEPNGVSMADR